MPGRFAVLLVACALLGPTAPPPETQRALTVSARRYAFTPDRIEVRRGDVVRITFEAEDIPHSFSIDALRICKRAEPGHPVVIEFHADQPGTYPYYCNITTDARCRTMRGELVVTGGPGAAVRGR